MNRAYLVPIVGNHVTNEINKCFRSIVLIKDSRNGKLLSVEKQKLAQSILIRTTSGKDAEGQIWRQAIADPE